MSRSNDIPYKIYLHKMLAMIFRTFTGTILRELDLHLHLYHNWICYLDSHSWTGILQQLCRILHVLAQYVTVCNYAWMFCEGFYLHTLLVLAFTNEKRLLIICYVIAWGENTSLSYKKGLMIYNGWSETVSRNPYLMKVIQETHI
jgi:hypothetical protein